MMRCRVKWSRRWLSLFSLLLASNPLWAASAAEQDHQALKQIAHRYIQQRVEAELHGEAKIKIGNVDPRLRLPACPQIQAYLSENSPLIGNISVGIRCQVGKRWSLFVSAQVKLQKRVLVAKRALKRGVILGQHDVALEEKELFNQHHQYLTNVSEVLGQQLKRSVRAGEPLQLNRLEPPKLVRRGQSITILAEGAGVSVRMSGKALMDGRSGDRIQVENDSSNRRIEGVVMSDGVVKVDY